MIVLGIDIGKKSDPSALVGVDGEPGRSLRDAYKCERLPLGMRYPDQTREFVSHAKSADLTVVDGTGVGEAIVDAMRECLPDAEIWSLIITSGNKVRVNCDHRTAHIPKKVMVDHLVAVAEHEWLRLHEWTQAIGDEMHKFERRNGKFEARLGEHDDLLMALCMALMGFKIRELVG